MLSDRLTKLRLNKKLTHQQMADFLGITRQAYGYYESGKRDIDTATLNKLADFFDVKADYLLGRTNDPSPIDHSSTNEPEIYISYRYGKKSIDLEDEEEAELIEQQLEQFRAWKAQKKREREQKDNQ